MFILGLATVLLQQQQKGETENQCLPNEQLTMSVTDPMQTFHDDYIQGQDHVHAVLGQLMAVICQNNTHFLPGKKTTLVLAT